MEIRFKHIFALLCIYNTLPAMEQQQPALPPATGPATAAAVPKELPPIFIGQEKPRFPIHGNAVFYSKTLYTMRDVADNPQEVLYPITQYTDQQLHFIANLLNFLYTEQQARGLIQNDRVITFIREQTIGYSRIPFNQILELIIFFDIPNAFIAITSAQPLPLPTTPAQEVAYNKQLAAVFNLARSTTHAEQGIIGSETLWQLFGRMLYPHCTKYPEIAHMIDFITAQPTGGKFAQTVRTIGRTVGSWLGAPKPSEPVAQKTIEQIVLGAYMQQHPELFLHHLRTIANGRRPIFSPDGKIIAIRRGGNIELINTHDGSLIRTIANGFHPVFNPDGQTIAILREDNIELINTHDGSLIRTIANGILPVFSPDGQIIAIQREDNTELIDMHDGSLIRTIKNTNNDYIRFDPNGRFLTTANPVQGGIQLYGYLSLREALKAPIVIKSTAAPAPAPDGSSAAPSAPARAASQR